MTSSDYKDCRNNGSHQLEVIIDDEDVAQVSFWLECSVCRATTNEFHEAELTIDGESISDVEYKEEQDELRAIDDDRIGASLK